MNLNFDQGIDLDDPETQRVLLAANAPLSNDQATQTDAPAGSGALAMEGGPRIFDLPRHPAIQHVPAPNQPPPQISPPPRPQVPLELAQRADEIDNPGLLETPKLGNSQVSDVTHIRHPISPEERDAQTRLESINVDQRKLARDAGDIAQDQSRMKEEAAADALTAAHAHQEATDKIVAEGVADWKRVNDDWHAKSEKYADAKPSSFFDDDPKGSRRMWAGIAMALGGFNARVTGGKNLGYEMIKGSIDAFDRKEREKIAKLKDVADSARDQFQIVDKHKQDLLADLSVKKTAMSEVAANELSARLATLGKPIEEIKTNATVVALRRDAAEEKAAFLKGARDEIHARSINKAEQSVGGRGRDPTGRAAGIQIQKATLAEHGQSALDTIDRLTAEGVSLTSEDRAKVQDNRKDLAKGEHGGILETKIGRETGLLARSPYQGLSKKKQELANAYEILAQKGAGITSPSHAEDEMKHARAMFDLLAPDEDDAIRSQKMDYARKIVGAARALGGRYSGIAERGAEDNARRKPAAPAAGPSKSELRAKAAEAIQWVRDNPKSPQVPEIKKRIAEFLKAGK